MRYKKKHFKFDKKLLKSKDDTKHLIKKSNSNDSNDILPDIPNEIDYYHKI